MVRVSKSLAVIRWFLLVVFVTGGLYLLMWSYQSASFSVPAQPIMSEVYKTRALLLFPLSILFPSVGVLFFFCLGCRSKDTGTKH